MKRLKSILFLIIAVAFVATSCEDKDEPTVDKGQIYGKWQSGTLHYRFENNKTGETWDTGDDVNEGEGTPLTWEITGENNHTSNTLELVLTKKKDNTKVPRAYPLVELTSSKMVYKDELGDEITFKKI
jgi:hypothetical protein